MALNGRRLPVSRADKSDPHTVEPRAGPVARFLKSSRAEAASHRYAVHPIVLGGAYVLYLFVEVGVTPHAMFRSLAIAVAATAILTVVATLAVRDRHKGAFVATWVLLIVVGWKTPLLVSGAAALMIVVGLLARRVTGTGLPWPRVTYVLNVLAGLFVLTLGLRILVTGGAGQIVADFRQGGSSGSGVSAAAAERPGQPPDIYLVLLDAYPRGDVLQRVFDYNNEPFLRALEARGFEVSRNSHSNYSLTELTMTSVLNMQLLHDMQQLRPIIERQLEPQPTLRNMINDSRASRLLRQHGYQLVATAAGYEEVALRHVDVFIDSGHINEFEVILMRETALGDLISAVAPHFLGDQYRGRIEAGFDTIRDLVGHQSNQPTFGLIHLPTPHAPIVYGRNGEPREVSVTRPYNYDSTGQTPEEQVSQFRDQLEYVNRMILDSVDDVLASAGSDAVVILWSDHGTRIDLDTETQFRLQERVSNLFAARTPGRSDLFTERHTLVNTLPVLFDAYLGTDIKRSPDRLFVSESTAVFDWIEVHP